MIKTWTFNDTASQWSVEGGSLYCVRWSCCFDVHSDAVTIAMNYNISITVISYPVTLKMLILFSSPYDLLKHRQFGSDHV